MLVGEGRAPRSSGAPPDSVQVDHVQLQAIPATHAGEEEAQVDRARFQAIRFVLTKVAWPRAWSHCMRWTLPSRQGLEEARAEAAWSQYTLCDAYSSSAQGKSSWSYTLAGCTLGS